jgi:tripartite-type tricarboxylate transporter receptor subunit TctC
MKIIFGATVAVLVTLLPASAQEFPNRPVRTITALSAGGTSDVFMRVLGDGFQKRTGQPIIVENRPGGAFNIAGAACADSSADGYNMCLLPVETLAYNQFLFKKIAYDPEKLEPITNAFFVTQILVASAALGVKSMDELAALSKAKPGTLSYMAPSVPLSLFMDRWKQETKADLVKVPYKGGADAVNNLLSGSTPVAFLGLANVVSQLQAGTLVPLAVDTEKRSPLFPDVPTVKELGYKGPLTQVYFGFVAPAGTPKPMIEKLREQIVAVASDKGFQERSMIALGLEPILDTPDQFAAYLKANRVTAQEIVKESGSEPQ